MAVPHNRSSLLTLAQSLIDADESHAASRIIDVAKAMRDGETIIVSDAWQREVDKCLEGRRSELNEAIRTLCLQRGV